MMKRTAKFYRKNEREVMKRLGMQPTKNSGSGWVEKGDGQNESIVCELKSTDAASYRICLDDLHKVEHHADISHKNAVLAVQFLATDEIYLVVKLDALEPVFNGLNGIHESPVERMVLDDHEDCQQGVVSRVASSSKAKQAYADEVKNKYQKERKAT